VKTNDGVDKARVCKELTLHRSVVHPYDGKDVLCRLGAIWDYGTDPLCCHVQMKYLKHQFFISWMDMLM
jgi:hypothetical protein